MSSNARSSVGTSGFSSFVMRESTLIVILNRKLTRCVLGA